VALEVVSSPGPRVMLAGPDRQLRTDVLCDVALVAGVRLPGANFPLEVVEGDLVDGISSGLIGPLGHEVVLSTELLR